MVVSVSVGRGGGTASLGLVVRRHRRTWLALSLPLRGLAGRSRECRVRGAAGGPGLAPCPRSVRPWGAAAPWLSPEKSCSCLSAPAPFLTVPLAPREPSPRAVLRRPALPPSFPSRGCRRPGGCGELVPVLQNSVKKPAFNLRVSLGAAKPCKETCV